MTATASNTMQADEQFKAYLLKILAEDDVFVHQIQGVLRSKKSNKKPQKGENIASKENIPYSEMPYWKLRADFKPRDSKPYAIKKDVVAEIQEYWKDAPPAEELIAQLTK
jgi:hypothetical protein